jgi:Domain of unknown function (DUF1996)
MARRRTIGSLASALAVAAVLLPSGMARSVGAETVPDFVSTCTFSHRAMDDPIVEPNRPGAAHRHDFFGNRTTDAFSTLTSLHAAGSTTCDLPGDTAAYWVPTLLEDGHEVTPTRLRAYYRPGTKDPASLRSLPAGLKMVAGDAHATAPQATRVVTWGCGVASTGTPGVPTCRDATLVLHVYFPDCWDGTHLDSPDHRSHMVYTRFGRCPADHPVPVPKLTEDVLYPIRGGPEVALASGSASTAHADFFNAWRQPALDALVQGCLVHRRDHCTSPSALAARPAASAPAAGGNLLPFTGGHELGLLAVGVALIGLGTASVAAGRRRRPRWR